jgi:hypothetical protein
MYVQLRGAEFTRSGDVWVPLVFKRRTSRKEKPAFFPNPEVTP